MSNWLSRGIRIYEHATNGMLLSRSNYNFYQGMNEIADLRITPGVKVVGVGNESGAMVVHYQWAR